MSDHLGKTSFLDTPDVNGSAVLTVASLPAQLTNLVIPGTEGFTPPAGTTAQRPASPVLGETRYNTTLNEPEVWSNGAWLPSARVIQVASGQITNGTQANVTSRTTTTIPLVTEGAQLWTTSFTPLVVGSSLVIQFTITAAASAARLLMSNAFVGSTSVGTAIASVAAVSSTTTTAGFANISLQVVFTTTSAAALTIQGRLMPWQASAAATTTLYWNQLSTNTTTFGGALLTEWRILEIIQ